MVLMSIADNQLAIEPNQEPLGKNQFHDYEAVMVIEPVDESQLQNIEVSSLMIEEPYEVAFAELEIRAKAAIEKLMIEAYNDYKTKVENGEKISYQYFYQNYYTKAQKIEKDIEEEFNQTLDQLQQELGAHGFSSTKADHYKEQFENKKQEQFKLVLMNFLQLDL